ncbi:MAG TPA: carboxylating nicotinate-nucleotide diphosphorylase [Candidatus Kapabacteria bacterium]|nr:carboxylating nicotinate-nucleotide diphosphorylase [Candidatus Kapabacteria bacterium]
MDRRALADSSTLRLVQIALAEDIGSGDVSAEALIDPEAMARGVFLAKAEGIIAGTALATLVFNQVDRSISCDWLVNDGDRVKGGQVIAHVQGTVRGLLSAERTALNFLQRMSGVATLTRRYVDAVAGTGAVILDTRKTIPGWRLLDKYSVTVGGGVNLRMGLYDMVMIKDNHIAAHGSLTHAVAEVRRHIAEWGRNDLKIEVETKNLEEVREALACEGIARIMFDNFPLEMMREAVTIVAGAVETEASGGVNLETVRPIAETGVQFISVGALTHSAPALDISLDFEAQVPVEAGPGTSSM